jgi:transposase
MSMKTPPQLPALHSAPDPEVSDRPQRRTFSVADKLRILEEVDRARPGDVGAILRREGLYSSNVGRWRRQRDAGMLRGLAPAKPGPKTPRVNPLKSDVERLERENARLRERLTRAEAVIDLPKNARLRERLTRAEAVIDLPKNPRRPAALLWPEKRSHGRI